MEGMISELWCRDRLTGRVKICSRNIHADISSLITDQSIVTIKSKDAVISLSAPDIVIAGCAKDQVTGIRAITNTPCTVNDVGDGDRATLRRLQLVRRYGLCGQTQAGEGDGIGCGEGGVTNYQNCPKQKKECKD